MIPNSRPIAAALAVFLIGCGGRSEGQAGTPTDTGAAPTVTFVGDTTFLELPVGRSADNGRLRVTLEGVTEDSRCPRDVQCVWEGNAGILLTLASGDETEAVVLNSTLQPRQTRFEGFRVAYRELTPYPASTAPIDPKEYVATITIVEEGAARP